jgi:extradiol dioxygenase family protein/aryl carrier-like protein
VSGSQFHLAFPVRDLEQARSFYIDTVGCRLGRETWNHIDFDMYGHQVVAHLCPQGPAAAPGEFDGHEVPVPHFGLNLETDQWIRLAERLKQARAHFREYPHLRLAGQVGEHRTMFLYDPSGNALEFKAFRDPSEAFAIGPAPGGHAPPPDAVETLRPRVEAVVHRIRGVVEEELVAGGLDSIGAMELMARLQDAMGVSLQGLVMRDVETVTSLTRAVAAAVSASRGQGADRGR